jgi:hypothetical protein
MNRKEAFLKIKASALTGGFTILDVIPFFKGVAPSDAEAYLKKAYDLGFITLNSSNPLCMYPTQKLNNLN